MMKKRMYGRSLRPMVSLLAAWAMGGAAAAAVEFHHDFGKAGGEGAALRVEGQKASDYVKRTPAGLVISLPDRQMLVDAVGVLPKFAVRGDFEITASYEITKLEAPANGYGNGVSLRVLTDASAHDGATIARFLHPKHQQVYATDRAADRSRGDRSHEGNTYPTEALTGKLRLVRQGTTLRYLVAEADSDEFRELSSTQFVDDDVTSVRVAADPGRSKAALEVRLIDFTVRADALPVSVGRKTAPFVWIIWSSVSVVAVVVVGTALSWTRSHRKRAA